MSVFHARTSTVSLGAPCAVWLHPSYIQLGNSSNYTHKHRRLTLSYEPPEGRCLNVTAVNLPDCLSSQTWVLRTLRVSSCSVVCTIARAPAPAGRGSPVAFAPRDLPGFVGSRGARSGCRALLADLTHHTTYTCHPSVPPI